MEEEKIERIVDKRFKEIITERKADWKIIKTKEMRKAI